MTAFWVTLTVGVSVTILHEYLSYKKDIKKKATIILSSVCGVIITIALAVASNFIFDYIKDESKSSNTEESITKTEINIGNNNNIQQGNNNIINNNYEIVNNITGDNIIDYSETILYQRLKDQVTENILCFVLEDFDNDGKKEAFAFVGEEIESEPFLHIWQGIPYFVSEKLVQKLSSNTRTGYVVDKDWYWGNCREIKFGSHLTIAFSIYYATSSVDEIYGVEDGVPLRYSIPNTNGTLNVTEDFITLTVDDYDAFWDESSSDYKMGHTKKRYYFHWNDGKKGFSEYGGIEITLEQLNKLKDVSSLLEEYSKDGYKITNILYRDNGIVNINFEKIEKMEHSYKNITLHIKHNSKLLSDDEIIDRNSGIYLVAINPKIAVYPAFPY